MHKLVTRIILIGLGMATLIVAAESTRTSPENAFWIASITTATWFVVFSLILVLVRLSSRPNLDTSEQVIKEDWGTYMTERGETAGGVCFLTSKRILFQSHGFGSPKRIRADIAFDQIIKVDRSDTKLSLTSEDAVYYFFINDSKTWEQIVASKTSNFAHP